MKSAEETEESGMSRQDAEEDDELAFRANNDAPMDDANSYQHDEAEIINIKLDPDNESSAMDIPRIQRSSSDLSIDSSFSSMTNSAASSLSSTSFSRIIRSSSSEFDNDDMQATSSVDTTPNAPGEDDVDSKSVQDNGASERGGKKVADASPDSSPRRSISLQSLTDTANLRRRLSLQSTTKRDAKSRSEIKELNAGIFIQPQYEYNATVVSCACTKVMIFPAASIHNNSISSSSFLYLVDLIKAESGSYITEDSPHPQLLKGLPITENDKQVDIARARALFHKDNGTKSPLDSECESLYMKSGRLRLEYEVKYASVSAQQPTASKLSDWYMFRRNMYPSCVISVGNANDFPVRLSRESLLADDEGNIASLSGEVQSQCENIILQQCEDLLPKSLVRCFIVFGIDEEENKPASEAPVLMVLAKYSPDGNRTKNVSRIGSINLTTPHDYRRRPNGTMNADSMQPNSRKNMKSLQARMRWRMRKVWADMCLSIGAVDDASRHYMNVIDSMIKHDTNRSDMIWHAVALEGLASAKAIKVLDEHPNEQLDNVRTEDMEIWNHLLEAINMYRLEGLPILEASTMIKAVRFFAFLPQKFYDSVPFSWQKTIQIIHEVSQSTVSIFQDNTKYESSLKVKLMLDVANAYFELGCRRKGALILIQTASLLPTPWNSYSKISGIPPLNILEHHLNAFVQSNIGSSILDEGGANEVANHILAIAAPVFGITSQYLPRRERPRKDISSDKDRISSQWALLKSTVALRMIATAVTSVSIEDESNTNTNNILIIWYTAISLLLDDRVFNKMSGDTARWINSILLYVSGVARKGTVMYCDSFYNDEANMYLSLGQALFSTCVPLPSDSEFSRKATKSPNPFIVGIANKGSMADNDNIFWVKDELAIVSTTVYQPFKDIIMDIEWMQLVFVSDMEDVEIDCHVLYFDVQSWLFTKEKTVHLSCIPRKCCGYRISGIVFGIGNITLITYFETPQPEIRVVERASIQIDVNGNRIDDCTGHSSIIQNAAIHGIGGDYHIPSNNCLKIINTNDCRISKMSLEIDFEEEKGKRQTELKSSLSSSIKKLKSLCQAALPIDPGSSMTINLNKLDFVDNIREDTRITIRAEYLVDDQNRSIDTMGLSIWSRRTIQLDFNFLGSVAIQFSNVDILRQKWKGDSRIGFFAESSDAFIFWYKITNGTPQSLCVNTLSSKDSLKDRKQVYISPNTSSKVAFVVLLDMSSCQSFSKMLESLFVNIEEGALHLSAIDSIAFGDSFNIPLNQIGIEGVTFDMENHRKMLKDFICRELSFQLFPSLPNDSLFGVIATFDQDNSNKNTTHSTGTFCSVVEFKVRLQNLFEKPSPPFQIELCSHLINTGSTSFLGQPTGNSSSILDQCGCLETSANDFNFVVGKSKFSLSLESNARSEHVFKILFPGEGLYNLNVQLTVLDTTTTMPKHNHSTLLFDHRPSL